MATEAKEANQAAELRKVQHDTARQIAQFVQDSGATRKDNLLCAIADQIRKSYGVSR